MNGARCRAALTRCMAMLLVWLAVGVFSACAAEIPGLTIEGQRFRYQQGDLAFRGILVKPAGRGPFPAVLISHGLGADGQRFGGAKSREFVRWGFVCIAPDYTHSNPRENAREFGASQENICRAKTCLDILQSLPEVDPQRLCAYGNSMGAYLTVGLAAEEPERLVAAAITAGGVVPATGFPAPSTAQAAKIKTPMLILHGVQDTTVPPQRSELLEDVLKQANVEYERRLFDGVGHDLHIAKAREVNTLIEAWFRKHTQPGNNNKTPSR